MKTFLSTVLGICMLCLVSANVVAGEAKAGQFTVIKAQYGAGETWADVKDKVSAEVKDGGLTIAASNDNFGDPLEGTAKSLKVVVRYNGADLTFSADENSTLTIDQAALDNAAKAAKEADEKALK